MFEFEYPYVFLILILFGICAYKCKPQKLYMYMPLKIGNRAARRDYLKEILKYSSIFFLVTAMASPILKSIKSDTKVAHAIMQLIDVSDSMSQGGIPLGDGKSIVSKLSVAKEMASRYIKERKNDHVGIIVFGDFAYVATPLSFDYESTAMILQGIVRGVAGKRTALYDALFLSARLLKKSPAKQRVVILLTDGFDTSSKVPYSVAKRAIVDENIKVFSIGIGRYGEYDEGVLRDIAKSTGGKFFRANSANTLLRVYEEIDKLQKDKLKDRIKYKKEYLYMYPLSIAIFALFGYLFLRGDE
jgi:Ca-activated chloride channel family protein